MNDADTAGANPVAVIIFIAAAIGFQAIYLGSALPDLGIDASFELRDPDAPCVLPIGTPTNIRLGFLHFGELLCKFLGADDGSIGPLFSFFRFISFVVDFITLLFTMATFPLLEDLPIVRFVIATGVFGALGWSIAVIIRGGGS